MNKLLKIGKIGGLLIFTGCAQSMHQVVERSDDLSKRPDWANVAIASYEKEGKIYFVSFVEVDGSSSKSAALNMSDEKALSEPMRSVVSVFLDQNQVGEELNKDDQFGRRIISATRGYRPPMPTLKVVHRYWEKVSTLDRPSELRAYSLIEISKVDFEQAKEAYLRKLKGDPEVKKILDEVGRDQRNKVATSQ